MFNFAGREFCGMFDEFGILACSVCGLPLGREGVALVCANRHSFDVAREGYVNLARKVGRADTREMLNARRAFLEQGHYRPLLDVLSEQISIYIEGMTTGPGHLHLLDAGCGEGYYLGHIHAFLTQRVHAAEQSEQMTISSVGIDLSKDAVRMAAKRYKESFFIVANLWERLPLQDGSMHVVVNIFAPRNVEEYSRVLAPGGLLLIAIPGPQHLQPLRERLHLLNVEEDKQQHVLDQFAEHFTSIGNYALSYKVVFAEEQVRQIVTMTPNYWHQDAHDQAIKDIVATETTIDFVVLVLRRSFS
jgi:SAM-dependent methyltransferase